MIQADATDAMVDYGHLIGLSGPKHRESLSDTADCIGERLDSVAIEPTEFGGIDNQTESTLVAYRTLDASV